MNKPVVAAAKVVSTKARSRVLHHYGKLKEVHTKVITQPAAWAVFGVVVGILIAFEIKLNPSYNDSTRAFVLAALFGAVLGDTIVSIIMTIFGGGEGH